MDLSIYQDLITFIGSSVIEGRYERERRVVCENMKCKTREFTLTVVFSHKTFSYGGQNCDKFTDLRVRHTHLYPVLFFLFFIFI